MSQDRPNIVYVICHDIGKHMGCYGALVETPNLDRMAAEGIKFNANFCNSVACSPSRGCAQSGLYAHTSGGIGLSHMGWPLPMEVRTIVDYMNDLGYETILSGVNHERHPRTDRYQVDVTRRWEDWDADRAVDNAVAHLEKRDRSKPFYLNIGTQQPHASSWKKTDEKYGGPVAPEDVWIPPYTIDTPHKREAFGKFQAAIKFFDRQMGRLFEALERLDYADNTIVVFTTDHGIANSRAKGTLYDRGIEIALLVRLPGKKMAGTEVNYLTQNIDYTPTLVEAAGGAPDPSLQGKSFWPLLSGGDYEPHEQIFCERNFHGEHDRTGQNDYIDEYDPVRCIRTEGFHYIHWFKPEIKPKPLLPHDADKLGEDEVRDHQLSRGPRLVEELYDLRHDPQEFVNLVDKPEYQSIKVDLKKRLFDWMEKTEDFALSGQVPERYEEPNWGPSWPLED
ncbi:MAG: sulfatase [Candidatus Sumerlaeia bacterium]